MRKSTSGEPMTNNPSKVKEHYHELKKIGNDGPQVCPICGNSVEALIAATTLAAQRAVAQKVEELPAEASSTSLFYPENSDEYISRKAVLTLLTPPQPEAGEKPND